MEQSFTNLMSLIGAILYVIYLITMMVCIWRIFVKAGRSGFLSVIPIVNVWTLYKIAGLPGWLSLIPVVNLFTTLILPFLLCRKFRMSIIMIILAYIVPIVPMACIAFNPLIEYEFKC